jgi:Reverse transcriptase (RNA-dependent DNA polymerase)
MAYRENRSTIDQVTCIAQHANEEFASGETPIAAFDVTDRGHVIRVMKRYEVPHNITKWLADIIAERRIKVTFKGATIKVRHTISGVAQGTVLAPFNYNVTSNEAIENERRSTVDKKLTGNAHFEQSGREDQTEDQADAESSTRVNTLILTN